VQQMSEPMTLPDDVVIRALEPSDLDRVLAINEANVPEVSTLDRDGLVFLVDESSFALVVDVGSEVAGFCLVLPPGSTYASVNYRWFMDRFTDAMYLDRVAFDAAYQGRGLGTALYSEVHERVEAIDGIARWTLEVNLDPPNTASLAFHGARGFTEVGQQHTPYGITVSLMERLVAARLPRA
jgi:uncharacterized protein